MKTGFRIEGGAQLAARLRTLSKPMETRVVKDALLGGAEPIQVTASALAPREPGAPDLADNIVVQALRRDGDDVSAAVGPARGYFYYGSFQELGTARHAAQPYLRPAFLHYAKQSASVVIGRLWHEVVKRSGSRGTGSGVGV